MGMSEATWLTGDVFDRMADIPDGSIDLIVTSPPFLALRSYLPADHPDKHKEIGSEATPAAFLSTLLALTREWRRVLAPHGSLCVELGDTYSSPGGTTDNRDDSLGGNDFVDRRRGGSGWPLDKSLCLLPTLYPASLAYGRNLLDPDDLLEPWRIRNLVVWHRPNPPVGALGDKVRPSTSYVTTACVSRTRWFDLDAERGPGSPNTHALTAKGVDSRPTTGKAADDERRGGNFSTLDTLHDTNGAPPLDMWNIPTAPYSGSHYATFPPALPRKLINLMCPMQVCTICGEPRRRITETTGGDLQPAVRSAARGRNQPNPRPEPERHAGSITLGWTDCGCWRNYADCRDTYRRGIVLDPFAGSGTTLMAASELGRDSIGIDLDHRNLDLAHQRLGMFLNDPDEVPA